MNILIFTNYYPVDAAKGTMTKIVNYFAESLVSLGHNIVVVNSSSSFPWIYYLLPDFVENFLENHLGYSVPNSFGRKKYFNRYNGVYYLQLPVNKCFPGEVISSRNFQDNFNELLLFLNNIDFTPDISVGHWSLPQVFYLDKVKEIFNCKTSLVFHDVPNKRDVALIDKVMKSIDNVGFRNVTLKNTIKQLFDLNSKNLFLNYSGVTDYFSMVNAPFIPKTIDKGRIKICFVGQLIKRKHPDKILAAVNMIRTCSFDLHFIGDGNIRKSLSQVNCESHVRIFCHGRLSREKTYSIIQECDFLIMISEKEAFGLVYLEAMLCRTIPIASYREGFDGIVQDRVNGFLCLSGDTFDLKNKIEQILSMNEEELYQIQRKAFETACAMTDQKMALKYISDITV